MAAHAIRFRDRRSGRLESIVLRADEETFIGRRSDCQVQLPDNEKVSRRHAAILFAEGRWRLRDLGSANGLRVDGRKIKEIDLVPGMRIQVGDQEVEFTAEPGAGIHGARGRRPGASAAPPPLPPSLERTEVATASQETVQRLEAAVQAANDAAQKANQRSVEGSTERAAAIAAADDLRRLVAVAEGEVLRLRGELAQARGNGQGLEQQLEAQRQAQALLQAALEEERRRRDHDQALFRELDATRTAERAQRLAADRHLQEALATLREAERELQEQQVVIQRLTVERESAADLARAHDEEVARWADRRRAGEQELADLRRAHGECSALRAQADERLREASRELGELRVRTDHLADENRLLHEAIPERRREIAALAENCFETLTCAKSMARAIVANDEVKRELDALLRRGLEEVAPARRPDGWRPFAAGAGNGEGRWR